MNDPLKDKITPGEWAEEFGEFLASGSEGPPPALFARVRARIHRELNPGFTRVFTKLAALHAVVGSFSLLLCSQFGMGSGHLVMNYFMRFGDFVCQGACGAMYLGLTLLFANAVLSTSELKRIRSMGYAPVPALGLLSLAVFQLFGAEVATGLALIWLLSGLAAGVLVTETGLRIRTTSGARAG